MRYLLLLMLLLLAGCSGTAPPPDLPRVLVLGDSVSMHYHPFLEDALRGEAVVVRPEDNCTSTRRALVRLEGWLADAGEVKVVQVNFGLHDLKRLPQSGGECWVPLPDYRANLRWIVETVQATGATVRWCNTTPIPPDATGPERHTEDVARYNAAASEVMAEVGVPVTNLYSFALGVEHLRRERNVHWTPAGSAALAGCVADGLREEL